MARKKPAKQARKAKAGKAAKKKAVAAKSARRPKAAKKAARSARPAARKAAKPAARKTAKKATPARASAATARAAKPKKKIGLVSAVGTAVGAVLAAGVKAALAGKKPNLDRPRKTVSDIHGIPSSLNSPARSSMAMTGRAELKERLRKNTSASPALTSGDVDADWQSAEAVGDEAPGGDNPTPDQDVVDDIGRALGVEYEDDEELQGGAEITDRDRHRWEFDPSSKDDFEDEN